MTKETGIVRRLDDLGRVVIPKEIRKIFRIREGDPLEIFVDGEGILLKKYSPFSGLYNIANEYADSLFENTGHVILITDKDNIIAVSGASKKDYLKKKIGSLIEDFFNWKRTILQNEKNKYSFCVDYEETYSSFVITQIALDEEIVGSIILISMDDDVKMGQTEIKLAETAAKFLAMQLS